MMQGYFDLNVSTRVNFPQLASIDGMKMEAETQLDQAIHQAAHQFYRLVILAGLPSSGKTAALQSVSRKSGWPLVNVNLELSRMMLELARSQRPTRIDRLLKEVLAAIPGDVVLLDNLEILFDTSLAVEPVRMLQGVSRNRTVVASWNGRFQSGILTYAEPGHPEFRQFKETESIVIQVGPIAS